MHSFIICIISLVFSTFAYSQQELEEGTFKFYVNGGLNTSQISNDSLGGFSKWGPVGGIGGFFMLGENYKNADNQKLSTYNSLDIGFILNAVWYIKNNFAFNLRYIQSITPTNAVSSKYEAQYHSVLSIKGMYIF